MEPSFATMLNPVNRSALAAYPQNPFFAALPAQKTLMPPTSDRVTFGKRTSGELPISPELNLHTRENPFDATVVSIETLKPEKGNVPPEKSDVFKIVLDVTGSNFATEDGKRARVVPGHHMIVLSQIPKGLEYLHQYRKLQPKEIQKLDLPKEHKEFLKQHRYSITDVQEGPDGVKVTLVVRRVEFQDKNGKLQQGLISNQLAKAKPGSKVTLTGPDTNRFLMPPDRSANMLLFSTGIASMGPLMDFFQTRFERQQGPIGETRLYSGYRTRDNEMCRDLYKRYTADPQNRFHYAAAFSRDAENPQRISDLMRKDADRIFELLNSDNTYVYLCGVWGVEVTVISTLLELALERHEPIDNMLDRIQEMKKNGHWRVEGSRHASRYK